LPRFPDTDELQVIHVSGLSFRHAKYLQLKLTFERGERVQLLLKRIQLYAKHSHTKVLKTIPHILHYHRIIKVGKDP